MPKGELGLNSTQLSQLLFCMAEGMKAGAIPAETVGDNSFMTLVSEWEVLTAERREGVQELLDDSSGRSPLEQCAFALELGCYPPPWAVSALVRTIQSYVQMAVHLKSDDGSKAPVDVSQITRLESFLFDGIPNGKTAIGHFRSLDSVFEQFCAFSTLQATYEPSPINTLVGYVEKYLSEAHRNDEPDSFIRLLRVWANKSDDNKAAFERLQAVISEKSRG